MSTDEEEGEENVEEAACPYCRSMEACAHLLLMVDITFRSAGRAFFMAFEKRLADILENRADDGGDIAFDELVDKVEGLADATEYYVIDIQGYRPRIEPFMPRARLGRTRFWPYSVARFPT